MNSPYSAIGEKYTAKISLFDGAAGKEPIRHMEFSSIAEIAASFRRTVESPSKKRVPLYSRGHALGGRERDDLFPPYLVVLDVDESEVPMQECSQRLMDLGVPHFAHTTWKHSPEVLEVHNYRVICDLLCDDWRTVEGLTRELAREIEVEVDPVSAHQICFYLPATDGRRTVEREEFPDLEVARWTPDPSIWDDLEERAVEEVVPDRDPETIDVEELRLALAAIENQSREQWVRTGQCLQGSDLAVARELWDEWSSGQDYQNYSDDAQDTTWESFSGSRLGVSSIFYDAREAGWRPTRGRLSAFEEFDSWDGEEDTEAPSRGHLLRGLNDRYAYVAIGLGRVWDEKHKRLMSKQAFLDLHLHPSFETGRIVRGEAEMESIGKTWFYAWPGRRTFSAIDFAPPGAELLPGAMNLWRGWGHDPSEGSCSRFLDHVHGVICSGEDDLYEWIMDWMAHLVQRPAEKPGTAIVLRSVEGTGKGFFGRALCDLAGDHGIHVTQPSLLTGQFTNHLANKLVIFADEVTWGGRRQEEGVLKGLITEPTMSIEAKGVDAYSGRSFCRVIIASNHDWVVPAGLSARRFMMLDVSDRHCRDQAYFGRLQAELDAGGLGALHHLLLQRDLSDADVRQVIRTPALLKQKLEGLDPITSWIVDRLLEGNLGSYVAWEDDAFWVSTRLLYDSFQVNARDAGLTRRATEMKVARSLREIFGRLPRRRSREEDDPDAKRTEVRLPGIKDARTSVDALLGQAVEWESRDLD